MLRILRSGRWLPRPEVGAWFLSGQLHRLCISGGDPREWSMMPVLNSMDWVISPPLLKPQNLLEQSVVPILLFVRLTVYCGSYSIMLYDDKAQTTLLCISQTSYL